MLRFKILASSLPLVLAALFAHTGFAPVARPCITLGQTVQMAEAPWQAQAFVSFTNDPAAATVRVQIVDDAAAADFAVVDDADTPDATGCDANASTRLIGIAPAATGSAPVIYLSRDGNADYRIFVHSASFTAREAAALIVSARGGMRGVTSAAL